MKYSIKYFEVKSNLETTGDDVSCFHVFIDIEDHPSLSVPLFISFDDLVYSIGEINPDVKNYIHAIRMQLAGYGPKHSKVFAILAEEEFDFMPHLQQYITDEKILDLIEFDKRIISRTPEQIQKSEETCKQLDTMLYPQYIRKYDEFVDAVDAALHEVTVKYFPELFEMDKEIIDLYCRKLRNTTFDFSREIDRMVFRNR